MGDSFSHNKQASMSSILQRYHTIQQQIAEFCAKYGRNEADVQLLAVGKKHPVSAIEDLHAAGHMQFAENYLQEAEDKIQHFKDRFSDTAKQPEWHFIGHIQSRKSPQIANLFDWVHTVASEKVANKLNQSRDNATPLNVLIQLNLQQEDSKSGVSEEELLPLAEKIQSLPNLRLRGLMILPKAETDFERQRIVFARCRELLQELQDKEFSVDHLSMGMTNDLEAAIAEGATQVRIGTALFGPRPA